MIAGQPTIKVRDFLHYVAHVNLWTVDTAATRLGISVDDAKEVISQLAALGYVESKQGHDGRPYWSTTLKGNSLGLATAAKPVSRETAQRVVNEFLERVRRVNADEYYLYKVKKVLVFGSFLSDAPQLNDVDMAVQLEPKETDREKHWQLCSERTRAAEQKGRHFSNCTEDLFWAQTEVTLFLKARSRTISLHQDDPIVKQVETRVLFEEP
jgi:predicted nucleotidyltransferase